jgi:transcriptional regulator with XRE-family HTH domain
MEPTNENDLQTLGRRIRSLREQRGLTQVDLAKRLKKSKQLVSAWARGRVDIPVSNVFTVARALQCHSSDLMGSESHANQSSSEQKVATVFLAYMTVPLKEPETLSD